MWRSQRVLLQETTTWLDLTNINFITLNRNCVFICSQQSSFRSNRQGIHTFKDSSLSLEWGFLIEDLYNYVANKELISVGKSAKSEDFHDGGDGGRLQLKILKNWGSLFVQILVNLQLPNVDFLWFYGKLKVFSKNDLIAKHELRNLNPDFRCQDCFSKVAS